MRQTKNPIPKLSRVSFAELQQHLKSEWEPGQHFSIIAPTGRGKTTVAVNGLLPLWKYVMVLDAKGEDSSLAQVGKQIGSYPSGFLHRLDDETRYRITPPLDKPRPSSIAASVFDDAFSRIWEAKQWTVYIDELRLFSDPKYYGLAPQLDRMWLFGRARGLTLIAGTQAPRWCPAAFYEQPRRFLIGRVSDERALKRLGEISHDTATIWRVVPTLEPFHFLYIDDDVLRIVKPIKLRG